MDRYLYSGDSIVGIAPPTKYELELEQRCEQLEQLVKYMYRCYVLGNDWGVWGAPERQWVEERMEQLGLLGGEKNA